MIWRKEKTQKIFSKKRRRGGYTKFTNQPHLIRYQMLGKNNV